MKLFPWLLALFLLPMAALADDAELYDPAPPANSAFVRVVNGLTDAVKREATLGKISLGAAPSPSIGDYRIIPAGKHPFVAGKAAADFTIAAGKYYSVLLFEQGKPKLVEDELISNPAKTRVYFYNLSDAAQATIFASTQKIAVIDKLESGGFSSREMNALKLALQVKAEDTPVKDFHDVPLKRRIGTSFLLAGKKGAYQAVMVSNVVKR